MIENEFLPALKAIDVEAVYIPCLDDTDSHGQNLAEIVEPQGKICSLVGNREPINLNIFKSKSVTFAWGFMSTKSEYNTPGIASPGKLSNLP